MNNKKEGIKKALKNVFIENARIAFRNFSGNEAKFNPAGQRNFCVLLDPTTAAELLDEGWNIKFLKPKDPAEDEQAYLKVSVSYTNKPPKVVTITSKNKTFLDEDTINILDWAEFSLVDLIINPYDWEVNGKAGVKAYLKSMYVTLVEDELELKYANVPDSAASALEDGD